MTNHIVLLNNRQVQIDDYFTGADGEKYVACHDIDTGIVFVNVPLKLLTIHVEDTHECECNGVNRKFCNVCNPNWFDQIEEIEF